MTGLIASQIRITGDLEKDQQLLIYGIGGLIGLIVIAMIVILVVVLVRRSKASRLAAMPLVVVPPVQEESYKPVVAVPPVVEEPAKEEIPQPVAEIIPEPKPEPQTTGLTQDTEKLSKAEATPDAEPAQTEEKASPKYDFGAYKEELANQNPDDKMDEIRRRLEEIKRQRHAEPAPVLPKIEAKPASHEVRPATEAGDDDPIVPEEEILAEEEIDETRLVNEEPEDPETVSVTEVPQVERLEPEPEVEPQPEAAPEEETPASAEPPVDEISTAPVEEASVEREEIHSEGQVHHTVPNEPVMELQREPETQSQPEETAVEEEIAAPTEPSEIVTPVAPVEEEASVEREEIRSEGQVYYTVPNEPVMELQRDPQPESVEPVIKEKPAKPGTAEVPFPNGKFLPMKKLTFAEWVELFK